MSFLEVGERIVELSEIDRDALERVAALCRRSLVDPPEAADLGRSLFGRSSGAIVRGDPDRGVVATVRRGTAGFVRLLAVDPEHRGRGLGRSLLRAAEADLAGSSVITVGADIPDYLWPGIDIRETPAICLFESMGYDRKDVHYNMTVDLARLPPDPGGVTRPGESDRAEIEAWLEQHWPNWRDEAMSGFDRGYFLLARDEGGIAGFSAWNVNRRGWFGPTAVRRELIGSGIGQPLLIGSLHAIRDEGLERAEIAWVGPHKFYSRVVGAVIGRVFWVMQKQI